MKRKSISTPIVLAIAALVASPAFAGQRPDGQKDNTKYVDAKADLAFEANAHASLNTSNTSVMLRKTINNDTDVDTIGRILVGGLLFVDSSVSAVINDSQVSYQNRVDNEESTNSAVLSGNVVSRGAGNIGINAVAGDNNQQANAAAISAADASFVFGATDAEAIGYQNTENNRTSYQGQTNLASLEGNIGSNAAGNIGVNITAGNSNQQKNDLAIATGTSRVATASVSVAQLNDHNSTSNDPIHHEEVQYARVNLSLKAGGTYMGGGMGGYAGTESGSYTGRASGTTTGQADQIGNVYPDMWSGASHTGGYSTGHFDLDTQTQGGSDLNDDGGALAFNEDGSYKGSEGGTTKGTASGSLGFVEAGYQTLAGTVSGMVPVVVTTNLATTNTASLTGNVLSAASGNIGLNVAAGTNNQQYNGLSIAAIHGGSNTGGAGGEILR